MTEERKALTHDHIRRRKKTVETTFLFFPDGLVTELRHFLQEAGTPDAYAEPVTMVSRMDIKDLERKLWEIDGSEEAMEWDERRVEEMLTEEQACNERLEGRGTGLTRESEDVR